MAKVPEVFTTDAAEAVVEMEHGGAGSHIQPEFLGLAPYQIVSVAMLLLLLIAVFGAKVHKKIAGGLDNRIAAIRDQLDEAKRLRGEAEALRDEYSAKIGGAEKDAAAMRVNAQKEADAILAKAESDGAAIVERRRRMAEEQISAAEREAVADVRAKAALVAAQASRSLIAERHDAGADRQLADRFIAQI